MDYGILLSPVIKHFKSMAFYARRSLEGFVSQLYDFKMAASGACFMEKLPVFVSGVYGTTARKTGDVHNFLK